MNISEINVFGDPDDFQQDRPNDDEVTNLLDECPMLGLMEGMYIEPKPYGATLSVEGTEKLLKEIGYRITQKDGVSYALKEKEKLSRSPEKRRRQTVLCVYRDLVEDMAIRKFKKDWNELYGSGDNTPEA